MWGYAPEVSACSHTQDVEVGGLGVQGNNPSYERTCPKTNRQSQKAQEGEIKIWRLRQKYIYGNIYMERERERHRDTERD